MNTILFFQVVIEGEIGKGTGGIAVDDIKIDNHVSQEDCRSKCDKQKQRILKILFILF